MLASHEGAVKCECLAAETVDSMAFQCDSVPELKLPVRKKKAKIPIKYIKEKIIVTVIASFTCSNNALAKYHCCLNNDDNKSGNRNRTTINFDNKRNSNNKDNLMFVPSINDLVVCGVGVGLFRLFFMGV